MSGIPRNEPEIVTTGCSFNSKEVLPEKTGERTLATGTAMESAGYIEVDLFSKDVDSLDHPEAVSFKGLLEEVAEDFGCRLTSFEVRQGTAIFAFDSDELMVEILKMLQGL